MPNCSVCGNPLAETDAVCPACGTPVDATHSCPRCGEEIAAGIDACPACGRLSAATRCAKHPEREATTQCVICGTPLCHECDQGEGGHSLCERHAAIPVIGGWAQVYSTASDVSAELIRENLEAEGIDARVLSQKDHFSFTVDIGDLSPVRVLVPAYAFSDAETVIRTHLDDAGEVRFACAECGEAYEPGERRCSACGAPLPGPAAGGAA